MGSVDDLLKELDDLPSGSRPSRPGPAASAGGAPSRLASAAQPPRASTPSLALPPNDPPGSSHGRSRSLAARKKDDIEALLSDLDFGGTPYNSMNGRNNPKAAAAVAAAAASKLQAEISAHPPPPSRGSSTIASRQKCTAVFVGGTAFPRGRGAAVGGPTCCDALRCTKCDFRVEQFTGQDWAPEVDYLFLRNNFPNEPKLAPMLLPRAGSVAYCCQCSWLGAVGETKLDYSSDVRWVCAGHLAA